MLTRNFVGPSGPEGCVKFNCMNRAVVERLTEVAHPYQEKYLISSRFCEEHLEPPNKWHYPNFEIVKEERLDSSS